MLCNFSNVHMAHALRMWYIPRTLLFQCFYEVQLWHFFYVYIPFSSLNVNEDSWQNYLMLIIFNCSPWIGNPYEDAVEKNAFSGLSLDAFLSEVHKFFIFLSTPS